MDNLKNIFFLLVFLSGMLGCIVAGILYFLNKTESFNSKILAAFLVTFSLFTVNYSLMTTSFFTHVPMLWRVLGFASFSYSPLAFIYVRSVLHQSYAFRKWDWLFFIPAVLHPLSLIPFHLRPTQEKIDFIALVARENYRITLEEESVLPAGSFFVIRIMLGVSFALAQLLLLYRWYQMNKESVAREPQNRDTFRWLARFTGLVSLFWIFILAETFYNRGHSPMLNYVIIITISFTILFVSIYLMLQPSLLYGLKGWGIKPATLIPDDDQQSGEREIRKYTLSPGQGTEIRQKLEDYLQKEKPYRTQGFAIADLAHAIGVPHHQLSAFINQEYAKNFNELINGYRIQFLMERQSQSDDFEQYTLEALSREAGFNSRAAFIASVKKHTGKTPSEVFRRRAEKPV